MSIFVGYKLSGQKGAFAAATGIVTPAFIAIILIAKIMEELIALKLIQNIFFGVGIGVIILVLMAVKEMWDKSVIDKFTSVIFTLSLILSACLKISPVYIIIGSALAGIIYKIGFRRAAE